jgi:hypothetical protein
VALRREFIVMTVEDGEVVESIICVLCSKPGGPLVIPVPRDYERYRSGAPEGPVHPSCDKAALSEIASHFWYEVQDAPMGESNEAVE